MIVWNSGRDSRALMWDRDTCRCWVMAISVAFLPRVPWGLRAGPISLNFAGTLRAACVQVPERIFVGWTFGEDCPPQALRFVVVAASSRKLGEVSPGEVDVCR
jgi:hypothetical protein